MNNWENLTAIGNKITATNTKERDVQTEMHDGQLSTYFDNSKWSSF